MHVDYALVVGIASLSAYVSAADDGPPSDVFKFYKNTNCDPAAVTMPDGTHSSLNNQGYLSQMPAHALSISVNDSSRWIFGIQWSDTVTEKDKPVALVYDTDTDHSGRRPTSWTVKGDILPDGRRGAEYPVFVNMLEEAQESADIGRTCFVQDPDNDRAQMLGGAYWAWYDDETTDKPHPTPVSVLPGSPAPSIAAAA